MNKHAIRLLLSTLVLVLGLGLFACIEQTPLNLGGDNLCGAPEPGDTVVGDTLDDGIPADSLPDTAMDTAMDTAEDTAEDSPEVAPDDQACVPACDGKACGEDNGCGGFCKGDCAQGWVCLPDLGICVPDSCTDAQGDFQATYPDPSLRALVNVSMSTTGQVNFTWDEVKELAILDANRKDDLGPIADTAGLECLLNLEVLWIAGHKEGQDSTFSLDISGLAGLTKLTHLDLRGNGLTDLNPITGLTDLVLLDLSDNSLGDGGTTPLATAAFKSQLLLLDLAGNGLMTLPPLQLYGALVSLDLGTNRITDLSGMAAMDFKEELVILQLEENRNPDLPDTTGITGLGGLEGYFSTPPEPIPEGVADYLQDWKNKLVIYANRLEGLDGLETMTSLQVLMAADNQIPDIAPLGGLAALTEVNLSANKIEDLAASMGIWTLVPPLTDLDLSWNQTIGDLGPLGMFQVLERLDISATGQTNMDFLPDWTVFINPNEMKLSELTISANPLSWPAGSPESPLGDLSVLNQCLKILEAEEIFMHKDPVDLPEYWLSGSELHVLEELRLGHNRLTGGNLATFNNAGNEGAWARLVKLSLADNEIEGGIDQLLPLLENKATHPLEELDLSGNEMNGCIENSDDSLAFCAFQDGLTTFIPPENCSCF